MVGIPGKSFSVADLAAVSVRRISLATSLYRVAMHAVIAAVRKAWDASVSQVTERIGLGLHQTE